MTVATRERFVSFSGGADSTALAIYLADKGEDFTLLFADTGAELPETYWIVPRVARTLNRPLVVVSGPTFFQRLTARGFYLPSFAARWCTRELKLGPLNDVAGKGCALLGICADEDHRMPTSLRPLVDAGIGKTDARAMCEARDLLSPAYRWRTSTSCFCCPFQDPWDWRHLAKEHPDLFALAEEWERLSIANSRGHTWNERFSLRQVREAAESQMEMFPKPRGEACAICQA
jgi:hypothetical protein